MKARQGEADVKVISGAAMSEAVLPANVEVNGAQVGVTFDGTFALVNCQPAIATEEGSIEEGSIVEIYGE